MFTRIFMLFSLLLPHSVYAGEVPKELFGVTLGMTAIRTQDKPAGEMTIKRLTGLKPWSRGARYYYEPEQVSEAFPFIEFRSGEEEFYSTNHSSLVLPVIPDEVNTATEWEEYVAENGEQFTVMSVEYTSQKYGSTHAAYLAASALCEEKRVELDLEPSRDSDNMGSSPDDFSRSCFFITDDRELEINQNGPKYVYRLLFSYAYISRAEKLLADKANAIQRNEADELGKSDEFDEGIIGG